MSFLDQGSLCIPPRNPSLGSLLCIKTRANVCLLTFQQRPEEEKKTPRVQQRNSAALRRSFDLLPSSWRDEDVHSWTVCPASAGVGKWRCNGGLGHLQMMMVIGDVLIYCRLIGSYFCAISTSFYHSRDFHRMNLKLAVSGSTVSLKKEHRKRSDAKTVALIQFINRRILTLAQFRHHFRRH